MLLLDRLTAVDLLVEAPDLLFETAVDLVELLEVGVRFTVAVRLVLALRFVLATEDLVEAPLLVLDTADVRVVAVRALLSPIDDVRVADRLTELRRASVTPSLAAEARPWAAIVLPRTECGRVTDVLRRSKSRRL